jgi:hypothetical protein
MLQELAAHSGTAAWAIGSMLFFLAVFIGLVAWVAMRRPEEMKVRARMPLEGDQEGFRSQDSGIGSQDSGTPDP